MRTDLTVEGVAFASSRRVNEEDLARIGIATDKVLEHGEHGR